MDFGRQVALPSFFIAKEVMSVNNIAHQRMVQEALKKKFGSHAVLIGKRVPDYPEQAEREFKRVTNSYMRLLNKLLKEYLPEIRDAAAKEKENQRHDDTSDLLAVVAKVFDKMADELKENAQSFGFKDKVEAMSKLTRKLSISEWKKEVKATLGIELADDYYTGELFRRLLNEWIDENVDLIETIPHDSLSKMRELVLEGYREGKPTTTIVKEIQKVYGQDRRHAQLIARDQIAKLNSQISRMQQEDAGVKEYIWSTSGDSRVREGHRRLNNKRFRWDNPPVVDDKTGRRCHPGEDYQCRCVALAVFDYDTIDLPISGEGGG